MRLDADQLADLADAKEQLLRNRFETGNRRHFGHLKSYFRAGPPPADNRCESRLSGRAGCTGFSAVLAFPRRRRDETVADARLRLNECRTDARRLDLFAQLVDKYP